MTALMVRFFKEWFSKIPNPIYFTLWPCETDLDATLQFDQFRMTRASIRSGIEDRAFGKLERFQCCVVCLYRVGPWYV